MGNKKNIQKWVDYYAFQLYEDSHSEIMSLTRKYLSSPMQGINFWADIEGFENVEFISPLGTKVKFSNSGRFILNGKEM